MATNAANWTIIACYVTYVFISFNPSFIFKVDILRTCSEPLDLARQLTHIELVSQSLILQLILILTDTDTDTDTASVLVPIYA